MLMRISGHLWTGASIPSAVCWLVPVSLPTRSVSWGSVSGLARRLPWRWEARLRRSLIIANRVCDGLDGAVARVSGTSDLGAYLDITLDFLFYSAIPFAFAVADPNKALAACFLIFSFVGTGSSFLAFAIIAQKRGISPRYAEKRLFIWAA